MTFPNEKDHGQRGEVLAVQDCALDERCVYTNTFILYMQEVL